MATTGAVSSAAIVREGWVQKRGSSLASGAAAASEIERDTGRKR